MPIPFPLPCQPLSRVKVGTERRRNELSFGWAISERGPRRRKKRPPVPCLLRCLHLVGNLVRRKKVVRIEPLNILAATQRRCCVSGGCSSLIRLRYHPNFIRLKSPRDCQSPVSGTVIDDNDLFVEPGLPKGGLDCLRDPFLGVKGRDRMETSGVIGGRGGSFEDRMFGVGPFQETDERSVEAGSASA